MSNLQAMHWRRHDTFSSTDPPGDVITASACGRIVLNREATPDASEADCSECAGIAIVLGAGGEHWDRSPVVVADDHCICPFPRTLCPKCPYDCYTCGSAALVEAKRP